MPTVLNTTFDGKTSALIMFEVGFGHKILTVGAPSTGFSFMGTDTKQRSAK